MLLAIIITRAELRDALVSFVSGIKQTHSTDSVTFYQKNNYIFVFSENTPLRDLYEMTIREYQPEKIILTDVGRSVDVDHEIGDIILPNIFFSFQKEILETEITSENRDNLIGKAKFLEIFDEQKDYFVEDYGLSVGGIIVENTPNDAEISGKLMTVYEADVYSENSTTEIVEIMTENLVPTVFLVGIVNGKIGKKTSENPYQIVAENMLTTIRLLNDEENL
ncbi:MAG: hypothetical protein ACTTH6_01505 [Candidatus Altimarinota bacterium]